MAAPRIGNVITAPGALGSAFLQKDDDSPLGELLRFLIWALMALVAWIVAGIREWAASMERQGRSALAVALQAAAVVALVVLCCCCCCGYCAAGWGSRRRGPDGEEAYGGHDSGPVVRYGGRGRGRYRGGIFSMHPNKPIF